MLCSLSWTAYAHTKSFVERTWKKKQVFDGHVELIFQLLRHLQRHVKFDKQRIRAYGWNMRRNAKHIVFDVDEWK